MTFSFLFFYAFDLIYYFFFDGKSRHAIYTYIDKTLVIWNIGDITKTKSIFVIESFLKDYLDASLLQII